MDEGWMDVRENRWTDAGWMGSVMKDGWIDG